MRWPVVGLLLGACAQAHEAAPLPQDALEQRVAVATDEAWLRAGLPTTDTACRLDQLQVEYPDAEWYDRACPGAWACLGWRQLAPVAYISPDLPPELDAHAVLHELLHASGYCYGRWGTADPYDAAHADPDVWAGPGGSRPDSVEQRAQRLLDD